MALDRVLHGNQPCRTVEQVLTERANKLAPKFAVGTQFKTRGKHPRICTVVDILRTFNAANELVRLRYVATHEFMGQVIADNDVVEASIAMGLLHE